MRRVPRLLDLFCGAGGCARGYRRAGFYVVGVDIEPHPDYPYPLEVTDAIGMLKAVVAGDVMDPPYHRFDAVHASPPCQGYTTMNNRHGSQTAQLIDVVSDLLVACGLPYVIENVPGALSSMRSPIELTGEMFGLRVHRPRLFESNIALLLAPSRPRRQLDPVAVYGKQGDERIREEVLAELREMEPYARLSAVGLTVVECHRDGETWSEVKDKRDAPGGRR